MSGESFQVLISPLDHDIVDKYMVKSTGRFEGAVEIQVFTSTNPVLHR